MSTRERERGYQMRRLANKALSPGEAAVLLNISTRQCRRLYKCWQSFGDRGLISGHRGRASNNRQDEMRATFISWYSGLHPHGRTHPKHASDCFHDATGVRVSSDKCTSLVIGRRLLAVKVEESTVASSPRSRRLKRGELIQIDGSDHPWLGEWRWTLLPFIDDATSEVLYAVFVPSESTFNYFDALSGYITRHGLPQAIYCDRHSVFFASATSDGRVPLTAFGRALATLDIEHIPSSCPQGRGRVERAHRTAQDRLLKEMANQIDLIGKDEAVTMTAANAFLQGWIVQRNTAFAVPAGDPEDAHRPCPYEHEAMRLILSVTDERKPRKNQPFSYNGQLYQVIDGIGQWRHQQRPTLPLYRQSDGNLTVYCNERLLTVRVIGDNERQQVAVDSKSLNEAVTRHCAASSATMDTATVSSFQGRVRRQTNGQTASPNRRIKHEFHKTKTGHFYCAVTAGSGKEIFNG